MESQWQAVTDIGEALHFEMCKGGYFSDQEEYGLRVTGKTFQDGTPAPDAPVPIQCVKAGTRVMVCGKNLVDCPEEITFKRSTYCDALKQGLIKLPHGYEYRIGYDTESDEHDYLFGRSYCHIIYSDRTTIDISGRGAAVILPEGKEIRDLLIYGSTGTNTARNFVVTLGSQKCTYEPYISGGELTTPCDLYEGDVWWPMSGKVEHRNGVISSYNGEDVPDGYASATGDLTAGATVVYPLETPVEERYAPQPVFAPPGTVNVLQTPTELAATLSATMLQRRT